MARGDILVPVSTLVNSDRLAALGPVSPPISCIFIFSHSVHSTLVVTFRDHIVHGEPCVFWTGGGYNQAGFL